MNDNKYNHKASQQRLQEIMRSEEPKIHEKVDIIEALSAIQTAYTKAGRNIPSFSDSMKLIALANS